MAAFVKAKASRSAEQDLAELGGAGFLLREDWRCQKQYEHRAARHVSQHQSPIPNPESLDYPRQRTRPSREWYAVNSPSPSSASACLT